MSPRIKQVGRITKAAREEVKRDQLVEAVRELNTTEQNVVKRLLCANLKQAYDETQAAILKVELQLPGGPSKSATGKIPDPLSHMPGGVPVPPPEDETESQYGVRIVGRPNPYKQELLDQALALGCAWAKEEQEKQE